MAYRRRTSQLTLKLDVIVEEDVKDLMNDTPLLPQRLWTSIDTSQNMISYPVTLQNSKKSSGNDPEFLHTGRWPGMNLVEQSAQCVFPADVEQNQSWEDIEKTFCSESIPDTWQLITIDQLSMAMDFWDPDERTYPFATIATPMAHAIIPNTARKYVSVTAMQQSLFHQEIIDEHLIRVQTVEHLEELEDNDNAIEIVAVLESYRQNGWAEEMIKAFPRECWVFWLNSGLASSNRSNDLSCVRMGTSVCTGTLDDG